MVFSVFIAFRWTSPEALERGKYSSKSDVWAFGVTIWELYTNGTNPFASMANADILPYLRDGKRLDIPADCPDDLTKVAKQCWEWEPSARPDFAAICAALKDEEDGKDAKDNTKTPKMTPYSKSPSNEKAEDEYIASPNV